MELYLAQHGEAKPEAEDPERPLTERGSEAARRLAAWAAQVGVRAAQIRHSGKRRAGAPVNRRFFSLGGNSGINPALLVMASHP
jgi:phosphohistidine phosphatase